MLRGLRSRNAANVLPQLNACLQTYLTISNPGSKSGISDSYLR